MARQVLFWLTGAATGLAWFFALSLPINPLYQLYTEAWIWLFVNPFLWLTAAGNFIAASLISQFVLARIIRANHKHATEVAVVSYTLLAGGVYGTLLMLTMPIDSEAMSSGATKELNLVELLLRLVVAVIFGFPTGLIGCLLGGLATFPVGLLGVWLMRKISGVEGKGKEQTEH